MDRVFPDKLELDQLQEFLGVRNAIKYGAQVSQCLVVADAGEGSKAVPLARRVALAFEECGNEVGGVGDEGGRVLVDGCYGENGILPYVGMTMLETGPRRGEERLEELGFPQLAKEAQCVAADILVRVLQVVPDAVAAG